MTATYKNMGSMGNMEVRITLGNGDELTGLITGMSVKSEAQMYDTTTFGSNTAEFVSGPVRQTFSLEGIVVDVRVVSPLELDPDVAELVEKAKRSISLGRL